MEELTTNEPPELAAKIARLVEERGWNQEEFARIARVNRHTARQILLRVGGRSLRNSTVLACARALGLSVNDLRSLPLERLLPLMRDAQPDEGEAGVRRLYEQATQPELVAWLERNPDRRAAACRLRSVTNCLPCKARRGRSRHSASRVSSSGWNGAAGSWNGFTPSPPRNISICWSSSVDLLHDKVQPGRDRP